MIADGPISLTSCLIVLHLLGFSAGIVIICCVNPPITNANPFQAVEVIAPRKMRAFRELSLETQMGFKDTNL